MSTHSEENELFHQEKIMHEAEILLSDHFAEFSGKVTALHERKKEMNVEFKKLLDGYKADIKAIDDEAMQLSQDFEAWRTAKLKPKDAQ